MPLSKIFRYATSFLAGVFLFGLLYFCGEYLNDQQIVSKNFPEVKEFFLLVVFLGISTGHYIGKSLKKSERLITYFLTGFFCSLSLYTIIKMSFWTPISGVLICGTLLLLFLHISELASRSENIEQYIDIIAGKAPIIIFSLSTLLRYILPLLEFLRS